MYGIWLVICGLAAWYLARWSAQRRLNRVLFGVLVVVALINLAQLVYVFGFSESLLVRSRTPFERFLQHTDRVWLVLYLLWPFAAAIGIAQASLKISSGRASLARWISFGCSVVIAAVTPLCLVVTTCGVAGACL
jgi:hypothetical protein